jgi:hypothetical protein
MLVDVPTNNLPELVTARSPVIVPPAFGRAALAVARAEIESLSAVLAVDTAELELLRAVFAVLAIPLAVAEAVLAVVIA